MDSMESMNDGRHDEQNLGYREREARAEFALKLFDVAMQDMRHEFTMLLAKVGEANTTAHQHVSEREALAMVEDQMQRCVSMPSGRRREWLKLAATALGHVVSLDINAGHISPALPKVDR